MPNTQESRHLLGIIAYNLVRGMWRYISTKDAYEVLCNFHGVKP